MCSSDLEQITFNGELFRGLPQVFGKGVVTTEAEVLRFLAGLEGEINRRQALYQLAPGLPESLKDFNQVVKVNQKLPVLLVFVEEITVLAGLLKAKLLEPLQRLIIRCRKYGVYFILSGQNFRAEVIDKVIEQMSDWSASAISSYSHKDMPWLASKEGEEINYELAFYRDAPFSVRNYGDEIEEQ